MRVPYVYRNANTVVTIGLKRPEIDYINAINADNVRKIHIFAFGAEDVDSRALRYFAEHVQEDNVSIIVHCFSKRVRRGINKDLTDIRKGRDFHFRIEKKNHPFRMRLHGSKMLEIGEDGVRFVEKS